MKKNMAMILLLAMTIGGGSIWLSMQRAQAASFGLFIAGSQAVGTDEITLGTGTWADMADMSIELTTSGGDVLLMFSSTFLDTVNRTTGEIGVRFEQNTTIYHTIWRQGHTGFRVGYHYPASMQYLVTGLAAGTYTFKVQWRSVGENAQAKQPGNLYPRVFTAIELKL